MKKYFLEIKIKELALNYEDSLEAENKELAARAFYERLPQIMKDWAPYMLYGYILKEEVSSAVPEYE